MSQSSEGAVRTLYRPSLALATDLYELTMAYAYWRTGLHDRDAVFHLTFRENPFQGGFSIACGLHAVIDYLRSYHFADEDLAYLAALQGPDGCPLFCGEFLQYLKAMTFACDVDAIAEGTIVFPHEPLVRVKGPLLQAQLLETVLLNLVNFQTLIATKAARVVLAAQGEPVVEFGMRRAQGLDGALSASRAAYVGGCVGTSNVLAGQLCGIPVKGTHAHSWVMCFDTELEAFQAYAEAMPNNVVFLVDTYDTLDGVRHAVQVGKWLRQHGHRLLGIRLDSGDLAQLSIEARRILDAAGFTDTPIFASNDLDEHLIADLKRQGATISIWGVGTRLATAYDQPALGGVYKLSSLRTADGRWHDRIKLSEGSAKSSMPGILQVRRFCQQGRPVTDVIYDDESPIPADCTVVDPAAPERRHQVPSDTVGEDLLVPVFRRGECVYDVPPLDDCRRRAHQQLAEFHAGIKRLTGPDRYLAGFEAGLYQRKSDMTIQVRGSRE